MIQLLKGPQKTHLHDWGPPGEGPDADVIWEVGVEESKAEEESAPDP